MAHDDHSDTGPAPTPITRRRLLAASGTSVLGLAAFTGSATAHEVSTIAFCGCSQVTVWGAWLNGREGDETGQYVAVLYCEGTIHRRPLSGTQTRQRYSVEDDGDDCQIIALEGRTYDGETGEVIGFTICNEHCPANCAAKGLADEATLEEHAVGPCDDPSDIGSGGSRDGISHQTVTVQCNGCGRSSPSTPGRGKDRPGRRGRGRGR